MAEAVATKQIYKLFSEFCKNVKSPAKTKVANAGKFSYKYADLADVQKAVNEALPKGMSCTQKVNSDGSTVSIETIFYAEDGSSITSGPMILSIANNGRMSPIQAVGSTITYGRRYQLSAMAGIASDEDDDGASAGGNANQQQNQQSRQQQSKPKQKPTHIPATKVQINQTNNLAKQIAKIENTNVAGVYGGYKVSDVNALSKEQCDRFIGKLEADLAKLQETMQQQSNQQQQVAEETFDKAVDDDLPF